MPELLWAQGGGILELLWAWGGMPELLGAQGWVAGNFVG